MNEKHQRLLSVLESRAYESLLVRRRGKECYFIIRCGGKDEVFLNEFGRSPESHQVWQIRQWLNQRFGIAPDDVKVVVNRVEQ